MKKIIFQKVGDISYKYSFLEVYFEKEKTPFMEINITDSDELEFNIYPSKKQASLSKNIWEDILNKAKEFQITELENENYLNSLK